MNKTVQEILEEYEKYRIIVDYFIKNGTQYEKDIIKNLMEG